MLAYRPLTIAMVFDRVLKLCFNKRALLLTGLGFLCLGLPGIPLGLRLVSFYRHMLESIVTGSMLDFLRWASVLDILLNIFLFLLLLALYCLYNLMATELYGQLFLQRVYHLKISFVKQLKNIGPYFLYLLMCNLGMAIVSIVFWTVIVIFTGLGMLFAMLGLMVFMAIFTILGLLIDYALYNALEVFVRLTIPSMVIEKVGLFKAFGRSFSLVIKSYWQVFGLNLLFNFIKLALAFILISGIGVLMVSLFSGLVSDMDTLLELMIFICVVFVFLIKVLDLMLTNTFNVVLLFRQRLKYESLAAELLTEDLISGQDKPIPPKIKG